MALLIVVLVQPGDKGGATGVVGGDDLAVGPIGLRCAVVAFDLAVLTGAVRLDQDVQGSHVGDHGGDVIGASIAQSGCR